MHATASSHTSHRHMLAVIVTELARLRNRGVIRILDVGCGNGHLLAFLHQNLAGTHADRKIEFEGFDLSLRDRPEFPESTIVYLDNVAPGFSWRERISAIEPGAPWPHASDTFDIVVSNQVLEHVMHLEPFMREIRRVLAPGGISANLFPVRSKLFDGHVVMPLVHRVSGHEQLIAFVALCGRLGIGKLRGPKLPQDLSVEEYARIRADYLSFSVWHRPWKDFAKSCKELGLRISYRYTGEFLFQKLRSRVSRPAVLQYRSARNPILDWFWFVLLRYVTSVTLTFEKPEIDRVWRAMKSPTAASDRSGRIDTSRCRTHQSSGAR
jgi:SAM-dependent methyltransferase